MVGVPHEEALKVHITVKCDLLKINLMKHLSNRESWKKVLFCSNSVKEKQRGNSTNLIPLSVSPANAGGEVCLSIASRAGCFGRTVVPEGQGDTCTSRCWAACRQLPHCQLPGRIQPGLSAALISATLSLMPHSHQCRMLVNATPGSSALQSSQGFCFFTYASINSRICAVQGKNSASHWSAGSAGCVHTEWLPWETSAASVTAVAELLEISIHQDTHK